MLLIVVVAPYHQLCRLIVVYSLRPTAEQLETWKSKRSGYWPAEMICKYMLVWHRAWMWNTCSGWMELPTLIPRNPSVPPRVPPPHWFTSLLHIFSSFSSSFSSHLGWGAWQALNCGACEANARPIQAAREQPLGEWKRPSSLSVNGLIPAATAHPSPIHPKGSDKNATSSWQPFSSTECRNLLLLTNTQIQSKIPDIQHNW